MAKAFHEHLSQSLNRALAVAVDSIIQSQKLSRRDRERLQKGGWLQSIITGWYVLSSPQAKHGESTTWYASFWHFLEQYLHNRLGKDYCLSAESSLDIHTANNIIPKQVVVITKSGGNMTLTLPHQTSILSYQDAKKFPLEIEIKDKLQIMPLSLALCRVSQSFFQSQVSNAEIALLMIRDPSELTRHLLQYGMVFAAGRLAGAYRWLRKNNFADNIIQTMHAAKFNVVETNPFQKKQPNLSGQLRLTSPYYGRIISMWQMMRKTVIANVSKFKKSPAKRDALLKTIDDVYVHDAYNSLSIEGYKVSKALIAKIQNGEWNPDKDAADHQQGDALAAKGYYEAFLKIKASIKKIVSGKEAISIIQQDLPKWYQSLFAPCVEAGLIEAKHLAGYRNDRVYIRSSLHVPPPKEALLDCMDAFFNCLQNEDNPIVRAVLGHFIFVFIHPYMDGNGRIGRFLMNALWLSAGFPWTIVRVESRETYLQTLEKASVEKDIAAFTNFIAKEMAIKWKTK